MRLIIGGISLMITTFSMVGCGQSGALQLQSDQNYDKRVKYLLHSNTADHSAQMNNKAVAPTAPKVTSEAVSEAVSQ